MLVHLTMGKLREVAAEEAAELPAINVSAERAEKVLNKWEAFSKAKEDGKKVRLHLSSHEINTLINYAPKFSQFKGRVLAKVTQDKLIIATAIPLAEFPVTKLFFSDQYFNSVILFTEEQKNVPRAFPGPLNLKMDQVMTKGKEVSEKQKEQLHQLLNSLFKVAEWSMQFTTKGITRIAIQDASLVIEANVGMTPKNAPSTAEPKKLKDTEEEAAEPAEKEVEKKTEPSRGIIGRTRKVLEALPKPDDADSPTP